MPVHQTSDSDQEELSGVENARLAKRGGIARTKKYAWEGVGPSIARASLPKSPGWQDHDMYDHFCIDTTFRSIVFILMIFFWVLPMHSMPEPRRVASQPSIPI